MTDTWVRWATEPGDHPLEAPTVFDRVARRLDEVRFRVMTGSGAPATDPAKLWDVRNILDIATRLPKDAPMLDCGAFNSEALHRLARQGYRALHGVDLNPHLPATRHRRVISYSVQDMQDLAYETSSFSFVFSASTIEHGVSWAKFADEARRVLVPGGLLYVSTDVVGEPPPDGATAFDLPWSPLLVHEVAERADLLRARGFEVADVVPPPLPSRLPYEFLGADIGFVALLVRAT